MYPGGKIRLSAGSALAYTAKFTQPLLAEILDSGGLATIFTVIEFARLYLQRFEGERPGYASSKSGRPTPIYRRGMRLTSSGIHPQNLPLIPLPSLSLARKD
jgi:hypothetical protein